MKDIATDTDTTLTLSICKTTITDCTGERDGDYTIGITLKQDTGAEGDGELFTALTTEQAYNLINEIESYIQRVEYLNTSLQ